MVFSTLPLNSRDMAGHTIVRMRPSWLIRTGYLPQCGLPIREEWGGVPNVIRCAAIMGQQIGIRSRNEREAYDSLASHSLAES